MDISYRKLGDWLSSRVKMFLKVAYASVVFVAVVCAVLFLRHHLNTSNILLCSGARWTAFRYRSAGFYTRNTPGICTVEIERKS